MADKEKSAQEQVAEIQLEAYKERQRAANSRKYLIEIPLTIAFIVFCIYAFFLIGMGHPA